MRNINIELPLLRKREGDIKTIVLNFINKFCERNNLPVKILSDELLAALCSYNWPGNVRELINVLENVLAAAGRNSILYPDHLPIAIRAKIIRFSIKPKGSEMMSPELVPKTSGGNVASYKQYREHVFHEAEKPYLENLMGSTDWNIQKACKMSELSRSRLYALLKKHNISKS